jgi:hypothetical protein
MGTALGSEKSRTVLILTEAHDRARRVKPLGAEAAAGYGGVRPHLEYRP